MDFNLYLGLIAPTQKKKKIQCVTKLNTILLKYGKPYETELLLEA
jgi:hypothetical protein